MSKIIISDVLNSFVTPVAEGGFGIPDAIVDYMTEIRSYTSQELFVLYEADGDLSADAKALDYTEFKKVVDWMIGKEFDGKTITNQLGLEITYTQEDSFGANTLVAQEGIDNGDGTRTVTMEGWKPDDTQFRWGIAYPVAADTDQFSTIHSTVPTFTGNKGETYTLLVSCLIGGVWKTKEITVGLAA